MDGKGQLYDRSERMRLRWKDPAYRAARAADLKRRWADPEMREPMLVAARNARASRTYKRMPDMTPAQRLHYSKCRKCGIPREEALKAVMA